jgi:hypothetical protein
MKAGGVAQVVQFLPNKHETMSPNPNPARKKDHSSKTSPILMLTKVFHS